MTTLCCICSQLQGDQSNDLLSMRLDADGSYVRRVLYETDELATIPSMGGLGDAHLLICPREHTPRFASASVASDVLESYLSRVMSTLRLAIEAPRVHVFEHGNPSDGSITVCSVEHAHLHVVASSADAWGELGRMAPWQEVRGGLGEVPNLVGDSEYLFYQRPDGVSFVALPREGCAFESQLIRRVLAAAEGRFERWNWRDFPELDALETLFGALHGQQSSTVG